MMRFGEAGEGSKPTVTFTVDGTTFTALAGDTIATALYAAGLRSWRKSRAGDPRGVLCGIGYCFDCLVMVDGMPDVRACQTLVRSGMVVTTNREQGNDGAA